MKEAPITAIYIFRNKLNGALYAGQSVNIRERLKYHKKWQNSSRTPKWAIDSAIKKYGWDNFDLIVEENIPEDMLDFVEVSMIYSCDSIVPSGYNINMGGNKHKHASAATRKKMSENRTGEKNAMYGRKQKDSTKALISESKKGKAPWNKGLKGVQKQSLESKKKISEKTSGKNHPMYGKRGPLSPNYGKHRPRWPSEK